MTSHAEREKVCLGLLPVAASTSRLSIHLPSRDDLILHGFLGEMIVEEIGQWTLTPLLAFTPPDCTTFQAEAPTLVATALPCIGRIGDGHAKDCVSAKPRPSISVSKRRLGYIPPLLPRELQLGQQRQLLFSTELSWSNSTN